MRILSKSIIAVLVVLLFAAPAMSQANLGLFGVGAKVGYVDPEDIDATFGFGAVADLGKIKPNLGLEAELGYWSKSYDMFGLDASLSAISIAASAKYLFAMQGSNIQPYAGGGLGFHIFKAKAEYMTYHPTTFEQVKEEESDSETKIGFHINGGAMMELSPQMTGFAELRYALISDVNTLSLMAGVIYSLKK
ncbi:porin family protein [candidate division KSB1 bacterium]|nr:porin family protein [candidate division KSB1 bacterium]